MLTAGTKVMTHNGPGTPLEPCVLINLEKPADPNGIEVWTVVYDSEPKLIQLRAFPCQCPVCLWANFEYAYKKRKTYNALP